MCTYCALCIMYRVIRIPWSLGTFYSCSRKKFGAPIKESIKNWKIKAFASSHLCILLFFLFYFLFVNMHIYKILFPYVMHHVFVAWKHEKILEEKKFSNNEIQLFMVMNVGVCLRGDVKKVILGGANLKLGGVRLGPDHNFLYASIPSKTWKNEQKIIIFMLCSYLGVIKDRLSSWLSVQTPINFGCSILERINYFLISWDSKKKKNYPNKNL